MSTVVINHVKDYDVMSARAADIIENTIENTQDQYQCNLGLPTGDTPLGTYHQLVKKNLDWTDIATFNLDNYLDLSPDHPASFTQYMRNNLHNQININKKNIFFPTTDQNYDDTISTHGGLDLILLGLGINGHIAFNEPGSTVYSTSRIVDLLPQTLQINSKNFPSDSPVPTQAVTMGIATILKARRVVLLVQGYKKLNILKQAMWNFPSAEVPASFLQLHKNLQVFYCD